MLVGPISWNISLGTSAKYLVQNFHACMTYTDCSGPSVRRQMSRNFSLIALYRRICSNSIETHRNTDWHCFLASIISTNHLAESSFLLPPPPPHPPNLFSPVSACSQLLIPLSLVSSCSSSVLGHTLSLFLHYIIYIFTNIMHFC